MMYRYQIIHVPGKSKIMRMSDLTSRYPVRPSDSEEPIVSEASIAAYASRHTTGINAIDWETVRSNAACDLECSSLVDTIARGFPQTKDELSPELRLSLIHI